MTSKFISGVVLKETFVTFRRKWMLRFTLANLVYIIIIAGLSVVIIEEKKTIPSFPHVHADDRRVPHQR